MTCLFAPSLIVAGLWGYGASIGYSQNDKGVSLFQVAYTYNSLNFISQYGYMFFIRQNHQLVERAKDLNRDFEHNTN
ncbi:hypothetical protein FJ703_21710 [Escherichia coli]|nr:hypothetical protein [Escherichia coli]MBW4277068.1 hypothetical protein [Escherichia coli]TPV70512.1 hypothetical protein FJ703_21710 [Escherichia coli]